MNKIKTLKSLHFEKADTRINNILKVEAMKRVKIYRKQLKKPNLRDYKKWILVGRIREVKDFFNLTEADLK